MKKIIALLLIFAMCLSFVACNGSDKKDNDDSSDDKKTSGLCAECKAALIGEWFYIEEIYNEETHLTDYVLNKISIAENGKLVIDDKEITMNFKNCGKNHAFNMSIKDGEWNYWVSFQLHPEGSSEALLSVETSYEGSYVSYETYRSMNQLDVVEITEDNWKNYFSSDFKENFDFKYDLQVNRDTWGEITYIDLYEIYAIKNVEKYTFGSRLDIEYSYESGRTKYTYNLDEKKVTSAVFEGSDSSLYTSTTSFTYYTDYSGEEAVSTMESTLNYASVNRDFYSGVCEDWSENPVEILRMKGWIVMKKDA